MIIIHDRFANACRSFRRFMYIIHIDTTDRYRFGSTPISFVYVVVGHLRKRSYAWTLEINGTFKRLLYKQSKQVH
jgi:hypothetical protein